MRVSRHVSRQRFQRRLYWIFSISIPLPLGKQKSRRRVVWLQFAAVGVAERSRHTTSPPLSRMAIARVVPKNPVAPVTVTVLISTHDVTLRIWDLTYNGAIVESKELRHGSRGIALWRFRLTKLEGVYIAATHAADCEWYSAADIWYWGIRGCWAQEGMSTFNIVGRSFIY